MSYYIIGIDPGCTGAIVMLDPAKKPTAWMLMPTLKVGKNSEVNGAALAAFLRRLRADYPGAPFHALIEKVNAMPGQGVTSMFNFGAAMGTAVGVVAGCEIPSTRVTPQNWKKRAGLMGQDKDAARSRAIQLWPWWRELDLKGEGQAFADAALIAYYGSESHETTSTPDSRPASRRRSFV